jgi:hypothetical protein
LLQQGMQPKAFNLNSEATHLEGTENAAQWLSYLKDNLTFAWSLISTNLAHGTHITEVLPWQLVWRKWPVGLYVVTCAAEMTPDARGSVPSVEAVNGLQCR